MSCLPCPLLPITTLALNALYWVIRTENSLTSWWGQTRIKYRKYKSYYHPPAFFITYPPSSCLFLYKMSSLVLLHVRSDYFLKGIFSSPLFPSSPLSFPNQSLIFDLIVKCVELNEDVWMTVLESKARDSKINVCDQALLQGIHQRYFL